MKDFHNDCLAELTELTDLTDFTDFTEFFPAFMTIILMPFTYSIANGISAGLVLYPLLKLINGRGKEAHWIVYILAVLVVLRYMFLAE